MFTWINKRIARYNWFDLKLLGWGCCLLGLFLAAIIPTLLNIHWGYYLGGAIICLIEPYYKLLKK